MATIRRHRKKWQVQIRRAGLAPISKSFLELKDAKAWARHKEVQADRRELPSNPRALQQVILGELIVRYRDTVTVHKRGAHFERAVLNAFLLHPICRRRLSDLTGTHFAVYRDERLKEVKPTTLKRQLGPIRHMFEVARNEWGLPLRENPLDKLQLKAPDQRRERRLKPGELDKLIATARRCRNPLIAPIILFAVATGMRRGEILGIKRGHINGGRALLIPDTKSGQARTIPLTEAAFALLH